MHGETSPEEMTRAAAQTAPVQAPRGMSVALILLVALLAISLPAFFVTGKRVATDFPVRALFPFAHIVWFAVLGFALTRLPRLRPLPATWRFVLVLAVALVLGAAIEFGQRYAGRSASLEDVWANLLGAALGSSLVLAGPLRIAVLGSAVCACLWTLTEPMLLIGEHYLAPRRLPLISDFESAFQRRNWSGGEVSEEQAFTGRRSLARWIEGPGFSNLALYRRSDWQGYDHLELALHASRPVTVTVSIGDAQHTRTGFRYDDRYDGRFRLYRGWNEITIPLEAIAEAPVSRRADLGRISRFVVFGRNPPEPVRIHLDAVRLSRVSEPPAPG